jgi:hypothetical protein
MLPRSQGRQIHTAIPHCAHVKTRASAAATAPASRGLYNSGRARDPLSGYPVHRATARPVTPGGPGYQPGPPPSEPLLCLPHLPAPRQSAPRHLRWVTSDAHTPDVSRERLSRPRQSKSAICKRSGTASPAGRARFRFPSRTSRSPRSGLPNTAEIQAARNRPAKCWIGLRRRSGDRPRIGWLLSRVLISMSRRRSTGTRRSKPG